MHASVSAYSACCAWRPASGPRQDVPLVFVFKKVFHAAGNWSRRKVCPVGAVSNTIWS